MIPAAQKSILSGRYKQIHAERQFLRTTLYSQLRGSSRFPARQWRPQLDVSVMSDLLVALSEVPAPVGHTKIEKSCLLSDAVARPTNDPPTSSDLNGLSICGIAHGYNIFKIEILHPFLLIRFPSHDHKLCIRNFLIIIIIRIVSAKQMDYLHLGTLLSAPFL